MPSDETNWKAWAAVVLLVLIAFGLAYFALIKAGPG